MDKDTIGEILESIKNAADERKLTCFYEAIQFIEPDHDTSELRKYLVEHKYISAKQFDSAVKGGQRNQKIKDELGFTPDTVSEFVEKTFMEKLGLVQNLDGRIDRKASLPTDLTGDAFTDRVLIAEQQILATQNITSADVLDQLIVLSADLNLGYGDRALRAALNTFLRRDRQEKKTAVFLQLTYSKASERDAKVQWDNFEKSAFVANEYTPGFITAVMKKFIWQVKRKTRGLSVTDHLMPIVFGEQGAGKSMMITKFLSPLEGCFKDIAVNLLTDGKTNDIYDYPVLFLEELAQVQEASPELMKKVLTGADINNRTFNTQSTAALKQLSTFIAATNKRVQTMIRDETGMRRYVELVMMGPTDRDKLNALDFTLLWQSVDEEAADPTLPFTDELKGIQETMRVKSSVEEFLEDEEAAKDFKSYMKSGVAYNKYEFWCSRYGHKPMNKSNFVEKARTLIKFNHTLKAKWKVRANGNSVEFKIENGLFGE